MSKKLYFEISVKRSAADSVSCKVSKLKELWPDYQHNIYVTPVEDDDYRAKIEAYIMESGRRTVSAIRRITCEDVTLAGTFIDAADFIMENLLKRINKTQYTCFTRNVSCIDTFTAINIPKNPTGRDIVDSLTYAFDQWGSSRSKYKTWYKQYIDIPELKRVHSSGPVSVAIWSNGKKSMVRKQKGDKSDPEKGILYAVIKGLCYEKGGTKEYSRVLDMIREALEERKNG